MPENEKITVNKHIGQDFQPQLTEFNFEERLFTYQTFSHSTYTLEGIPVDILLISGYKDESGFAMFPPEVWDEAEQAIEEAGGNRTVFEAPHE